MVHLKPSSHPNINNKFNPNCKTVSIYLCLSRRDWFDQRNEWNFGWRLIAARLLLYLEIVCYFVNDAGGRRRRAAAAHRLYSGRFHGQNDRFNADKLEAWRFYVVDWYRTGQRWNSTSNRHHTWVGRISVVRLFCLDICVGVLHCFCVIFLLFYFHYDEKIFVKAHIDMREKFEWKKSCVLLVDNSNKKPI